MTLQEIESFLAVVQNKTLTDAANQLHITQPTLTHRIKSLENQLGVELIIRAKGVRMVEFTPAGNGFIPIAEKWARLWKETMSMTSIAKKKTFRIVATTSLGSYVMNEVYKRFIMRKHPLILDINTLHSEEAYSAVENGEIDIAFVARTMYSKRVYTRPIFSEKMVLLCRADTNLVSPVHPSQLDPQKCIHLYWTQEYYLWHEYWFGTNNYAIDADNMILVEKIVSETDYWMVAPLSAAKVVAKQGNIKILDLDEAPPNRIIYSLTRTSYDSYMEDLIEDLLNVIAELKCI